MQWFYELSIYGFSWLRTTRGKYRVGFVEVLRENLVMGAPGSILCFNTCCRLHVTLASSTSLTVAFVVKGSCCVVSVNIKYRQSLYYAQ